MRAKVCHMTSVHSARDVRIFHKMCASLAESGYDTYLVAPGESFEEKGVHVIGAGERPESRLRRMTGFAREVYKKALALDAELYHMHDPELLPYAKKLTRRGKRVVYDCHEDLGLDIMDKGWIPSFLRTLLRGAAEAYEKRAAKRTTAIISVSPQICEKFEAYHPCVEMVCNFPDIQGLEKYESPHYEGKRAVFAGSIMEIWSHENIIRAVALVEGAEYLFCGNGSKAYFARLSNLPGFSRAQYLGSLRHEEVDCVYRAGMAGMALLTAYRPAGTLGNTKLFEYMAHGLPVICTDSVLWKEIVQTAACGICVDPENVEEIADAIRMLTANPGEARRMGENGRRQVLERYNWGKEKKKLQKLYNTILEGRNT